MDDLFINSRLHMPLTTGIVKPVPPVQTAEGETAGQPQGPTFRQVLEQALAHTELSFSKHAADRVAQRGIPLSATSLERLNHGVQLAKEKGLEDALILMDGSAFIVSAKHGRVVTAMPSQELQERVFTNIDGTVIL